MSTTQKYIPLSPELLSELLSRIALDQSDQRDTQNNERIIEILHSLSPDDLTNGQLHEHAGAWIKNIFQLICEKTLCQSYCFADTRATKYLRHMTCRLCPDQNQHHNPHKTLLDVFGISAVFRVLSTRMSQIPIDVFCPSEVDQAAVAISLMTDFSPEVIRAFWEDTSPKFRLRVLLFFNNQQTPLCDLLNMGSESIPWYRDRIGFKAAFKIYDDAYRFLPNKVGYAIATNPSVLPAIRCAAFTKLYESARRDSDKNTANRLTAVMAAQSLLVSTAPSVLHGVAFRAINILPPETLRSFGINLLTMKERGLKKYDPTIWKMGYYQVQSIFDAAIWQYFSRLRFEEYPTLPYEGENCSNFPEIFGFLALWIKQKNEPWRFGHTVLHIGESQCETLARTFLGSPNLWRTLAWIMSTSDVAGCPNNQIVKRLIKLWPDVAFSTCHTLLENLEHSTPEAPYGDEPIAKMLTYFTKVSIGTDQTPDHEKAIDSLSHLKYHFPDAHDSLQTIRGKHTLKSTEESQLS